MYNDLIMCKETEKLVKILQGSQNPTDMALIILANKLDHLNTKLDTKIEKLDIKIETKVNELDAKWERRFIETNLKTEKQIEELKKATKTARWIDSHKKPLFGVATFLFILSACGVAGVVSWLKNKLGI